MDNKIDTKTWKEWWADEFYWLRNRIAHGDEVDHKRMTRTIGKHLLIAAIIFASNVKTKLDQLGLYQVSNEDKNDIDAIDCFIANGNLTGEKWQKCKQEAVWDCAEEELIKEAEALKRNPHEAS